MAIQREELLARQKALQVTLNTFLKDKERLNHLVMNESINSRQSSQARMLLESQILKQGQSITETCAELKEIKFRLS